MKGIEWGYLYNAFSHIDFDTEALEKRIVALMMDDDVSNKKGIYEYLLSNSEKHLNIRAFTPAMRSAAYTRQKGICPLCGRNFQIDEMEADHITPWCEGGKTSPDNCQMLCRECNRRKGAK
jgi:predicted  nucleic acid-binding Zn ribbon protein